LIQGAQGENVRILQQRLARLGYFRNADSEKFLFETKNSLFGEVTLAAVNSFKIDEGLWNTGEYKGVVGVTTWESLRLSVNKTIEQEFFGHLKSVGKVTTIKNDNLKFTITGNTTKFYMQEENIITQLDEYGIPHAYTGRTTVSQPVYDDYTKRIIEGFKEWSGEYTIQGVKTKVIVNVKAEQVKNAGTANVVITQNRGAASQVLTSVF